MTIETKHCQQYSKKQNLQKTPKKHGDYIFASCKSGSSPFNMSRTRYVHLKEWLGGDLSLYSRK